VARGRLAGLAAARDLGFAAADGTRARRVLRRAVSFQKTLWRLFQPAVEGAPPLPDEVIVCRCEEVTAGHLRRELAAGLVSVAALKKATRAGRGKCQGRICAATVARF
jgi:NAD(P)H-nitrite reductase large subunit